MPASRRAGRVPAFQLKITLRHTSPPIWRRLIIPGQWHLGLVHYALQTAMGWTDSHLHEFDIAGRRVGIPDPDWGDDIERETVVRLYEALANTGDRIGYSYDFGDGWEHTIDVEAILDPATHATCLAGRRACPPEDCGGPGGYEDLLAAMANPTHPDHDQMREWLGRDVHPEAFEPAEVNAAFQHLT